MNKMLSKRQVKALVLYSPQRIARLEAAGLFPKWIQPDANRVGWVEDDMPECRQQRSDARDQRHQRISMRNGGHGAPDRSSFSVPLHCR